MKNNPLVSIVVPTYNRKKLCERLIKSVLKSTYKHLEIIVVDDESPDETADYIREIFEGKKNIKVFRNRKNLFAAGSKNVGQNKTRGELIMFIDDDNVVHPAMVKELVSVFLEDPSVGEAGPVNYNFNQKNLLLLSRSTRSMWTTKTYHLRSLSRFRSKKLWDTGDIPNAFMVRGDVVRKNKIMFNPKFGIMYEESDYAYKISRLGYKIKIVRSAKIYHDIEDNLSKGKNKDYLYHFMTDKRRPFVFARNRILFHSLYSTRLQNLFILFFWVWFFTGYYMYKLLFYNGYGEFSIKDRLYASLNYLRGTIDGLFFSLFKTYEI